MTSRAMCTVKLFRWKGSTELLQSARTLVHTLSEGSTELEEAQQNLHILPWAQVKDSKRTVSNDHTQRTSEIKPLNCR